MCVHLFKDDAVQITSLIEIKFVAAHYFLSQFYLTHPSTRHQHVREIAFSYHPEVFEISPSLKWWAQDWQVCASHQENASPAHKLCLRVKLSSIAKRTIQLRHPPYRHRCTHAFTTQHANTQPGEYMGRKSSSVYEWCKCNWKKCTKTASDWLLRQNCSVIHVNVFIKITTMETHIK